MTPTGQRLFSIDYSNQWWHYDVNSIVADRIQPKYLLADFQLSYWPLDVLQQHLIGGVIRQEKTSDTGTKRVLYRGNKKLIEIQYEQNGQTGSWVGRVNFRHLERNYSVVAETLASEKF
jgi:hypothetical protein